MNSGSGLTPEEGIFKAPREGNYYFQFHGLVKYKQSNNMIISSCAGRKLTQNIQALQPSPRSVQATKLGSSWSSIQLQFFTSMIGCEKNMTYKDCMISSERNRSNQLLLNIQFQLQGLQPGPHSRRSVLDVWPERDRPDERNLHIQI